MASYLTRYYFTHDLLDSLEEKYQEQFYQTDYRIFLYSNFYDLGNFYKYNNLTHKDPYNLSFKLNNLKNKEFFEKCITYTRENGYSKDNVFLIYCFVANYLFHNEIEPFFNSNIKNHTKVIDIQLAKRRENIKLSKTNFEKRFKGAFLMNYGDIDLISYAIDKTYFFPKSENYYRLSLKQFRRYLKVSYKIHAKTKKNIDYFNSQDLNFDDIYASALKKGKELLLAINEYLFMNNDKNFKRLMK